MNCLLLLICFTPIIVANEIKFKDCGHNEIVDVSLTNCNGAVCEVRRGHSVSFAGDFVANQNSKQLEIRIWARVGDLDVDVPGIETNGCNHVKCPITKGEKYHFNYDFVLPKFLPLVSTKTTAQLVGEQGLVACLSFDAVVVD